MSTMFYQRLLCRPPTIYKTSFLFMEAPLSTQISLITVAIERAYGIMHAEKTLSGKLT